MVKEIHSGMCRHNVPSWEFRLVKGTYFEGISVREIYFNEKGNIIGWSLEPILTQAGYVKEVVEDIVEAMKDLDDMLVATKKPVLEESVLEGIFKNE